MAIDRKALVDFFFDTFPTEFQGDRTYWYNAQSDDADFITAFGAVFSNMSPENRRLAVDYLFDNYPENFKGDKTYWYEARGSEDQDFINAFGNEFVSAEGAGGGETSDRKQMVDWFFDNFPEQFQGDRTYWYDVQSDDPDFIAAFGKVFNEMSPEDRRKAVDYLFDTYPDQFKGDKTYWYEDRGAENQDFVDSFGGVFTGGVSTDAGGGTTTTKGTPAEESVAETGIGGGGPDPDTQLTILTGDEMKWYFDKSSGKWYVEYGLPNSDRTVVFEATPEEMDSLFGTGMRPSQYDDSFTLTSLVTQPNVTFAGSIVEMSGTGSFESEVARVTALGLDGGLLPDWAANDPQVMDIIYVAQAENKSTDWIINQMSQLDSFKARFPGIDLIQQEGNLTLAEGVDAFLEYEAGLRATLKSVGNETEVTPDLVSGLITAGHSLTVVQDTVRMMDRATKYAPALEAFNAVLQSQGFAPLSTLAEVLEFVSGQASSDLYDLYEASTFAEAAGAAGLTAQFSADDAMTAAMATAGSVTLDSAMKGMQQAANALLRLRHEVDMGKYGLNADDLIDLSLGMAPRSGAELSQINEMMNRAVGEAKGNANTLKPFYGYDEKGAAKLGSFGGSRKQS